MNFDLLDFTSSNPYFDIALEETLFKQFELRRSNPFLRLWTPSSTYIVVGTGQKIAENVNLSECQRLRIPIIRRFSGGGTVVHSNGQLCFSFFLPYFVDTRLADISQSYKVAFDFVADVLSKLGMTIEFFPPSDFALNAKKISGNASRRGKHGVLHHGTLLVNADISMLSSLLTHPPSEPEYRKGRKHESFITTFFSEGYTNGVSSIKEMFADHLSCGKILEISTETMDSCQLLVEQKYNTAEWNFKR